MNPQNITLSFDQITLDEVNAILVALQELPAKVCNPLTEKIRKQAETQLQEIQKAEEAKTHKEN